MIRFDESNHVLLQKRQTHASEKEPNLLLLLMKHKYILQTFHMYDCIEELTFYQNKKKKLPLVEKTSVP